MENVKFLNGNTYNPVRISSRSRVFDYRHVFEEEDELSKRKRKKRVNKVFVSRGGIRL